MGLYNQLIIGTFLINPTPTNLSQHTPTHTKTAYVVLIFGYGKDKCTSMK